MTTATPRTTPSKKMNLHFTFEFRNCLDLFSVPWSHNLLELHKYVTPAFMTGLPAGVETVVYKVRPMMLEWRIIRS